MSSLTRTDPSRRRWLICIAKAKNLSWRYIKFYSIITGAFLSSSSSSLVNENFFSSFSRRTNEWTNRMILSEIVVDDAPLSFDLWSFAHARKFRIFFLFFSTNRRRRRRRRPSLFEGRVKNFNSSTYIYAERDESYWRVWNKYMTKKYRDLSTPSRG